MRSELPEKRHTDQDDRAALRVLTISRAGEMSKVMMAARRRMLVILAGAFLVAEIVVFPVEPSE